MRFPLAYTLVASAACASQTTHPTGTPGTPGNVFTPDTTSVAIHVAGGLAPTPAMGSTCFPDLEDYTYVIATAALTWSVCSAPTPGGVYNLVPGNATLTSAQATDLIDALRALNKPLLPPGQACGGDFQEVFTLTSAEGTTRTYNLGDCLQGGDAVLEAIHAVTP